MSVRRSVSALLGRSAAKNASRWRCAMRIAFAICTALAVIGAPAYAEPRLPPGEWLRIESTHFEFVGNAPDVAIERIAQRLEVLHETLSRLGGETPTSSPLPTRIYVFRNDAHFAPYKPPLAAGKRRGKLRTRLSGFFQSTELGNLIAVNGDQNEEPYETVFHEYLHYFASSNFPDIPLWFNEGLAEYYSTFTIQRDQVIVGRPKGRHVRLLREKGLIPLDRLLRTTTSSPEYNENERSGVFYAQSWAIVHYLFTATEDGVSGIGDYLALVKAGERHDRAFRVAFGDGFLEFEDQIDDYIHRPSMSEFEVPFVTSTTHVGSATRLQEADIYFYLGDLLSQMRRIDEAEEHFEAALDRAPRHALSLAGLGYLDELTGNTPSAINGYELAVAEAPPSFLPYFLLGRILARSLNEVAVSPSGLAPDEKRQLERSRTQLATSIKKNPQHGPSWAVLGFTYLFDEPADRDGLRVLKRARALVPDRIDVLYNDAVLHARLGEFERAREIALGTLTARAEQDPKNIHLVEGALVAIAQSELQAAARTLNAGKHAEAITLAEAALEAAERTGVASAIDHDIEQLVRIGQNNLAVELYNRATDFARNRDYDRARQLAHEASGLANERRISQAINELLSKLP